LSHKQGDRDLSGVTNLYLHAGEIFMLNTIIKQLSLDYCCSEADVMDCENHFSEYKPLYGRRIFNDMRGEIFLKIAVINGKLLVSGRNDIITVLADTLNGVDGAWFMEAEMLVRLNEIIAVYGYQIMQAHPFYVAETCSKVNTEGFDIVWYNESEIKMLFSDDERFDQTFTFCDAAPDIIGVAALNDKEILGMAGANCESPYMWQVGVNTMDPHKSKGIGSMLVALLKNAVLERGVIPYYGTCISHIASQRLALKAGFLPMWAELITSNKKGQ